MGHLEPINRATDIAERSARVCQGLFAVSALLGFSYGARLSQFAFHGRVAIFSLDLLKDLYRLSPWAAEEDKLFTDLRNGEVCTLKNGAHFSALMVDLATVGFFFTDTLHLLPQNQACKLLNAVCDPFLVTLYVINLGTEPDSKQSATTALDLVHCLAPYLLVSWADKIAPATLIASGAFGLYATFKS